mgnify:FL=1
MKKTFELQLRMHLDAETEEDAVRQFLADLEMIDFVDSYRLRSDIAIDVRDIASGEDAVDAVKLTYI